MSDSKDKKDEAAARAQNENVQETPQDEARGQDRNPSQDASSSDEAKASEEAGGTDAIEKDMRRRIAQVRSQLRESFGAAVMAMMLLPRYRHQALADLQFLLLEPMIRNRVAIAHAQARGARDIAGVAIWASVSEEVDAKIREQIRNGVFPVRLKPEEWTSGSINWLLDVFAPDERTTATLIANFRKVTKGGELRLHPVVARMLSREMLEKMGIRIERREKEKGGDVPDKEKSGSFTFSDVDKEGMMRSSVSDEDNCDKEEGEDVVKEDKKLH